MQARDAGLVRGIGTWGVAANLVNYTIGASIFVVPALAAGNAGAWAPVALLVAAIANAAITICYAEAGARVATSGGQAGFTARVFGAFAGFVAGALTYLANVLAAGAILAAASDALAALLPWFGGAGPRTGFLAGWALLLVVANALGVRGATRAVQAVLALKLLPLLLVLALGPFLIEPGNLALPVPPLPARFGETVLLAVFLFAGVHGALLAGGEIRDPARTVPRALALGLIAITTIFIGAQLVAQGVLGPALPASTTPLADVMARLGPGWRTAMLAGTLVAMLGWTLSDALSTPRLVFAFARDGYLPAALGRLQPGSQVPLRAVVAHVAIAAALAIGGSFAALALVSSLLLVVMFIGAALAALELRRRGIADSGAVSPLPGLPVAAPLAIAVMLWVASGVEAAAVMTLLLVLLAVAGWYGLARVAGKKARPPAAGV
jgi:basic amino acid/polyamine antiporter, APA family